MLLFIAILLFFISQTRSDAVNRVSNGFPYLRKQVLELQKKNDQLENRLTTLVSLVEKLSDVVSSNMKVSDDVDDFIKNEAHYNYMVECIVEKIQDSLQFPRRKRKDMILDKESGIKYIIKKINNDKDAIGTNMILPDRNPVARYTYKVQFYVYGKFAEEDFFELIPTFDISEAEKSAAENYPGLYYHYRNNTFIDIFVYNETESVYFPRSFYETIDENGVIDVREF